MESDMDARAGGNAGAKLQWGQRLRQSRTLVPSLAVATVVGAAVAATVMVTYSERQEPARPRALRAQDVVPAPPLVVKAPPLKPMPAPAQRRSGAAPTASNAPGAGPACRNCGVVVSVAAANRQAAYQIRIRMDDGTLRTVEQRGALASGSRVVLEGGSVRVMAAPTRQG